MVDGASTPTRITAGSCGGEGFAERRRKLLCLHYDEKVSAELFGEQEADLTASPSPSTEPQN